MRKFIDSITRRFTRKQTTMSHAQVQRVKVTANQSYKHNGLKSYVYALQKYSIQPTQAGEYQYNTDSKCLVKASADGTKGTV